jgi:hypothetical protein
MLRKCKCVTALKQRTTSKNVLLECRGVVEECLLECAAITRVCTRREPRNEHFRLMVYVSRCVLRLPFIQINNLYVRRARIIKRRDIE